MSDAILYIGTCGVGYAIGAGLRRYRDRLGWVGKVQTLALICLVFSMGLRIGANEEVVANLDSYGLYALVFTVITHICSVAALFFVRKYLLRMDRYGIPHNGRAAGKSGGFEAPSESISAGNDSAAGEKAAAGGRAEKSEGEKRGSPVNSMTLMILGLVALGIACGFFVARRYVRDMELFMSVVGMTITVGLCVLLLFVGIDLGAEGKVVGNFKKVGAKVMLVPLAVTAGTFLASFICAFILPIDMMESFAIGSGFGWYSLAPGIIMDAGHMAAGAISFMHNVMREVIGIVMIPIVAKLVGYVECIALPGAAAMDVCLPIVERSTNGTVAVYSFISGVTLSIAVPLIVPLFV